VPAADLFTAAVLGDRERVAQLLRQDPRLAQSVDENGWPALLYCARTRVEQANPALADDLLAIARELVRCGADPQPALDWAVMTNKAGVGGRALGPWAGVGRG